MERAAIRQSRPANSKSPADWRESKFSSDAMRVLYEKRNKKRHKLFLLLYNSDDDMLDKFRRTEPSHSSFSTINCIIIMRWCTKRCGTDRNLLQLNLFFLRRDYGSYYNRWVIVSKGAAAGKENDEQSYFLRRIIIGSFLFAHLTKL